MWSVCETEKKWKTMRVEQREREREREKEREIESERERKSEIKKFVVVLQTLPLSETFFGASFKNFLLL